VPQLQLQSNCHNIDHFLRRSQESSDSLSSLVRFICVHWEKDTQTSKVHRPAWSPGSSQRTAIQAKNSSRECGRFTERKSVGDAVITEYFVMHLEPDREDTLRSYVMKNTHDPIHRSRIISCISKYWRLTYRKIDYDRSTLHWYLSASFACMQSSQFSLKHTVEPWGWPCGTSHTVV
jgi:hypothetical protein